VSAAERTRIDRYEPTAVEPRWQQRWAELGLFETDLADESRPKFYLLTMYPYPSGDLHIGHWYIKTPTDAIARFHRMHGENVFLPIGFDAFGLPAENAAIKNKIHPREWTTNNIERMRGQLPGHAEGGGDGLWPVHLSTANSISPRELAQKVVGSLG
jgi:leucyl-tRNA synthetase